MTSFSRFIAGAGLAVSLAGFPLQTFAATQQQLLQQALKALITNPTQNAAQGTLETRTQKLPLRRSATASTETASLDFSIERETNGEKNVQGQVRLLKASEKTPTIDKTFTFSPIPQAAFRLVEKSLFLQLSNLAPVLDAVDISATAEQLALFGRWIRLDTASETENTFAADLGVEKDLFTNLEKLKLGVAFADAKKVPVLLIMSSKPLSTGSSSRHMRVRVNPAFVNLLEQEALKLDGRDQAKRRATRTQFKDLRAELVNTQFAVVVDGRDTNKPVITRIEFFSRETKIEKGCDYTRFQKNGEPVLASYSCALNLQRIVTEVRGGINLTQKADVRVEAVTEATPFRELLQAAVELYFGPLFSEGSELGEEDDAAISASSTLPL